MQDLKDKTPEQQRYIELCADAKKLYHIQATLDEVQLTLSQGTNATTMMQVGYRLNQAMQAVKGLADIKYAQKKAVEIEHPAFKAEAQAYGKSRQQTQEKAHTQQF